MIPHDCHKETYEGGQLEYWEETMAILYPVVMADSTEMGDESR